MISDQPAARSNLRAADTAPTAGRKRGFALKRVLIAPGRYIQGPGVIDEIGRLLGGRYKNAFLIGGRRTLALVGEAVSGQLERAGAACRAELFGGEACQDEIERLSVAARAAGADLIIAAGGGKAIDSGKTVAAGLDLPMAVLPTIAATDAPCSSVAVVYSPQGVFEKVNFLGRNPDYVIVDSQIIAQSPAEYLVAGMGDALATYWEADTCRRSQSRNAITGGWPPTRSALALARLCYDTLLEHGRGALAAARRGVVSQDLEAIIEANVLLSGLGFESGGLATAHAVHNGLTVLPAAHGRMHGCKVAFGLIVQLVLEGRPRRDVEQVLAFCAEVGLPASLAALGLAEASRDDIRRVAEATVRAGETVHNTWFKVEAAMVEAAIWAADALSAA